MTKFVMMLVKRRQRTMRVFDGHEVLADKHTAEQTRQRPALRCGTERYICFKQIDLIATFEANAEKQDEKAQDKIKSGGSA